jgi:NAD(P)-dependent dehydrogenase (short-subunit alcohol dehydrogenase family)
MSKTSQKRQPVAIVTGGSRGIGRAISLELGKLGYSVVVNYVARRDAAEEVATVIQESGGRASVVRGNIAVAADRNTLLAAALDEFGRIDVLVNNAGIASPGRKDLLEATESGWDEVFATNLKGPFFFTQLVARKMIELVRGGQTPGGKIINISSVSSYTASINRGDYCMSKAALSMMTWLFAERLASEGIAVFEIAPGVIATDMTGPVHEKYDKLISEGMTPIRRWGQPADVARAVTAIVQDYFPFSTGERINVDGGFHMRRL